MRLRHVKNGYEILRKHPKVIDNVNMYKGDLRKAFENNNPLHIEVGSGKGQFIRSLSEKNLNINYLGFELNSKVIFRWLNVIEGIEQNSNYFIVHSKAELLDEVLPESSVDRVYLNFSDPWPKPRHEKRRLTSPDNLNIYKKILINSGDMVFKTDNKELFQYSLDTLKNQGWNIVFHTFDLYTTEYLKDNVPTEYESKFVEMGKKICKLVALP
jgi:tRNA (guanine-N7-)-methyltransferase